MQSLGLPPQLARAIADVDSAPTTAPPADIELYFPIFAHNCCLILLYVFLFTEPNIIVEMNTGIRTHAHT